MTYNVGNGMARPDPLLTMLRGSGADVVGLQEVDPAQADAIAADLADRYPYRALIPAGFSGVGVLSRYPVTDVRQIDLYQGRPDLVARVETDDVRLTVGVLHLPLQRLRWSGLTIDRTARAQLRALTTVALRTPPTVLLGDFNMSPGNQYYRRLAAMGFRDAFQVAGTGHGATLPRRLGQSRRFHHHLECLPLWPFLRFDYIWYSAPLCAKRAWVGHDAGSDHPPVLTHLTLPV